MNTAAHALTSIQNQATNLGKVSDYQWQNVTQIMNQMSSTMQQGQAVSAQMSNVDQKFRQRYPDYASQSSSQNYQQAYQQWNQTTLDTLRNSLSAASIDANNIQSEQDVMNRLQAQGASATGRMQALQVASEIAGENVNQLIQLRGLTMSQMSAQNAYMAYQVSKDSYNEKQLEALVSNTDTQFPDYKNNPHFGAITQ